MGSAGKSLSPCARSGPAPKSAPPGSPPVVKVLEVGALPRDPAHALSLAREGSLACERLAGDASDRAFSRVRFREGTAPPTAILVRGAAPPFVETARLLRGVGVPVPEIFAEDEGAGLVVEEDFGDTLLEEAAAGDRAGVADRYRALVDLLLSLQRRLPRPLPPGSDAPLALRRAFDAATFERELRVFEEHLWTGHLGARPRGEEVGAFRAFARGLEIGRAHV